ncbi:hypothetical protein [Streptomyces sp. ITFR-16]|uniref:hypothetical protein n=1 Tax=Streptomyces sp. ITFR-16 TaxID=3075198 RepID=UPI0028892F75|nr:hypothetical protein [Streptomyces sp. ITFR-16]WNI26664.1 hypothetical protein RLT58_34395 [Streptomyces sp. ITFR-16]
MNTSSPATPAPSDEVPRGRNRTRLWATLSAVLFVPALLATGVLTLASERASRCLTYGEECASGLPAWLFEWSAGIGALAFVVALAAPPVRVRQGALAAQVAAEGTALLVVLSHA